MKAKYLITLAFAALVTGTACKKDFLQALPSEFTTPEQLADAAAQDPQLLNGSISGLYTAMFTVQIGGTTGHDDFGQKATDIISDILSSDMVLAGLNYNWYSGTARYQETVDFTSDQAYSNFRYYYKQIFGANTIIDILGGTDNVPDLPGNKHTMGQAKIMRAYAYFYLSQLYAREYGNGSEKILPVYTTANPAQANQPKSAASVVWDLMISDLTQAITLLDDFTRTSKDQADKSVAKGLLAYVLAARGTQADWTQVVSLTEDIMAEYPATTVEQAVYNGSNVDISGFNNVATPSWIWGVDITLAQELDLLTWWGQVDLFTYSYAWAGDAKTIDRGLYDAIRADDARKTQFVSPAATNYKLMPINKFFHPGRTPGGQRTVTTDMIYMRADEFYLLNAEAKARLGQDGAARDVLKSYLADRIADLSYIDALSGQSLVDEIYLQTRIEFWGEGKSYLAMKRNGATITRGSNHLFDAGNSFTYNDPKLTFVIPQAEVLNNPNLNK
jgi:hypothetical protein